MCKSQALGCSESHLLGKRKSRDFKTSLECFMCGNKKVHQFSKSEPENNRARALAVAAEPPAAQRDFPLDQKPVRCLGN